LLSPAYKELNNDIWSEIFPLVNDLAPTVTPKRFNNISRLSKTSIAKDKTDNELKCISRSSLNVTETIPDSETNVQFIPFYHNRTNESAPNENGSTYSHTLANSYGGGGEVPYKEVDKCDKKLFTRSPARIERQLSSTSGALEDVHRFSHVYDCIPLTEQPLMADEGKYSLEHCASRPLPVIPVKNKAQDMGTRKFSAIKSLVSSRMCRLSFKIFIACCVLLVVAASSVVITIGVLSMQNYEPNGKFTFFC